MVGMAEQLISIQILRLRIESDADAGRHAKDNGLEKNSRLESKPHGNHCHDFFFDRPCAGEVVKLHE